MELLRDLFGRRIRLTRERLEHLREHPEMIAVEHLIAATLGDPALVVESVGDREVWLYYRFVQHPTLGEKLLCVVVKSAEHGAFVLTTYVTDRR